jgi:hypothetical protein
MRAADYRRFGELRNQSSKTWQCLGAMLWAGVAER